MKISHRFAQLLGDFEIFIANLIVHLKWCFEKQNVRIGIKANPQQTLLHPETCSITTVWCALHTVYFFKNKARARITVNGYCYRTKDLFDNVEDIDLTELWFQQDCFEK